MKGIVFTEFLEMVESRFGLEMADRIINQSCLATDGAYTAVGTYDHGELLQLVSRLSDEINTPVSDLVRELGKHLFPRFLQRYLNCHGGENLTFAFLLSVERLIHIDVRKLYPDAELPVFTYETDEPGRMKILYRSARPFADLAEGLILASIQYYGERLDLERVDLEEQDGRAACFLISTPEGVAPCRM